MNTNRICFLKTMHPNISQAIVKVKFRVLWHFDLPHAYIYFIKCSLTTMIIKIAIEYIPNIYKNIAIVSRTRYYILLVFVETGPNGQKRSFW